MGKNTYGNRPHDVTIIDEVDSLIIDNRGNSTQLSSTMPAAKHLDILFAVAWEQINLLKRHLINHDNQIFFIEDDFTYDGNQIGIKNGINPRDVMNPQDNFVNFIEEKVKDYLHKLTREVQGEEQSDYEDYKKLHLKITELKMWKANGLSYIPNSYNNTSLNKKEIDEELEKTTKKMEEHNFKKKYHPKIDIPEHLKIFTKNQIPKWVNNGIVALFYYKKGIQYSVKNNKIIPVDYQNTGDFQVNSVWSDGLAQFLQLKEGIPMTSESITTNMLSNVCFFKKYKTNLYGLTGTIGNKETQKFFEEVYGVKTFIMPPHKICKIAGNENSEYICKELTPIIINNQEEWLEKIASSSIVHASCGQGVLIICENVSEVYNIANKLSEKGYAKNKIFKYTGEEAFDKKTIDSGEIIVATNIAGRGTDIKPTQNVERNGGMHVCITKMQKNVRVDRQAAGRTARAGKKGTCQFVLYSEIDTNFENLKKDREEKENLEIENAQNDVRNILLKDKFFERFCTLLNEIIPSTEELAKESESVNLHKVWNKYKILISLKKEGKKAYQNRCKEIFDQLFETKKKEIQEDLRANIDRLVAEGLRNLSGSDRDEYNKYAEDLYKTTLEEKSKELKENLEKAIDTPDFKESFFSKFYNDHLEAFCDSQRGKYSPEVIDFMRKEQYYISSEGKLMDGANWDEYERSAVQERWGMWMKDNFDSNDDENNINESVLRNNFENFANELRNDAKENTLIKNVYYLIQKGNSRPNYSFLDIFSEKRRSLSAGCCYDLAIKRDSRNSANAHYNKALWLLSGTKENRCYFYDAKYHLRTANLLIEAYGKQDLMEFISCIDGSESGSSLIKRVHRKINILQKQQEYIQMAIDNICEAGEKDDWNVKIDYKSLRGEFEKADENYDYEIAESQANGLYTYFTATPEEPTNITGLILAGLLGLAQVVAGSLLFIYSCGSVGSGLISEGISDITASVKGLLGDGKFSWENYFISKAISIAVSLLSCMWDAIKAGSVAAYKSLVGVAQKDVTYKLTQTIVSGVATSAVKTAIVSGAEFCLQSTLNKKIEKDVFRHVRNELYNFLSKSDNVQKCIRRDNFLEINYYQNKVISLGMNWINKEENLSDWKKAGIQAYNILKSVLCEKFPSIGLAYKALEGLGKFAFIIKDLLCFCKKFYEGIAIYDAEKKNPVLCDITMDIKEENSNEIPQEAIREAVSEDLVFEARNGAIYESTKEKVEYKPKAACKSSIDTIVDKFAYVISGSLSNRLNGQILDAVGGGVGCFVDRVADKVKKDLDDNRQKKEIAFQNFMRYNLPLLIQANGDPELYNFLQIVQFKQMASDIAQGRSENSDSKITLSPKYQAIIEGAGSAMNKNEEVKAKSSQIIITKKPTNIKSLLENHKAKEVAISKKSSDLEAIRQDLDGIKFIWGNYKMPTSLKEALGGKIDKISSLSGFIQQDLSFLQEPKNRSEEAIFKLEKNSKELENNFLSLKTALYLYNNDKKDIDLNKFSHVIRENLYKNPGCQKAADSNGRLNFFDHNQCIFYEDEANKILADILKFGSNSEKLSEAGEIIDAYESFKKFRDEGLLDRGIDLKVEDSLEIQALRMMLDKGEGEKTGVGVVIGGEEMNSLRRNIINVSGKTNFVVYRREDSQVSLKPLIENNSNYIIFNSESSTVEKMNFDNNSNTFNLNICNKNGFTKTITVEHEVDKIPVFILRSTENSKCTIGTIIIKDLLKNNNTPIITIEPEGPDTQISNQNKRILQGKFKVKEVTWSSKNRKVPCIYNEEVSANRGILIHAGTERNHTQGCIIPGTRFNSKKNKFEPRSTEELLHNEKEITQYFKEKGYNNIVLYVINTFD